MLILLLNLSMLSEKLFFPLTKLKFTSSTIERWSQMIKKILYFRVINSSNKTNLFLTNRLSSCFCWISRNVIIQCIMHCYNYFNHSQIFAIFFPTNLYERKINALQYKSNEQFSGVSKSSPTRVQTNSQNIKLSEYFAKSALTKYSQLLHYFQYYKKELFKCV